MDLRSTETLASIFGGNLGDTLWLTPLARYESDLTVQMRGTDKRALATAPILDGLCNVDFVNDPPETPKAPIRAHVTQQILTAFGHGGKPSIPRVVLTADEIRWATDYLAAWHRPKMMAIVNHCSGVGDPNNYRARYVQGCQDVMTKIAAFWRGAGYSVFQFGPQEGYYERDIFAPIDGNICIRGLTVRQLAAAYHVVGKLVTVDTGDKHLGLSVGAIVACLVPPHSETYGYRHWDLLYGSICWGDEKPRLRYALQKNWHEFLNTDLFRDKTLYMADPYRL